MKKMDIGLIWAKWMNISGQMGAVQGAASIIMLLIVTYTTSLKGVIPLWIYVTAVILGVVVLIVFVVKIGISGYYRFFNQQSAMNRIERKLNLLLKEKGIETDE